jgi:hypothetical protein
MAASHLMNMPELWPSLSVKHHCNATQQAGKTWMIERSQVQITSILLLQMQVI